MMGYGLGSLSRILVSVFRLVSTLGTTKHHTNHMIVYELYIAKSYGVLRVVYLVIIVLFLFCNGGLKKQKIAGFVHMGE